MATPGATVEAACRTVLSLLILRRETEALGGLRGGGVVSPCAVHKLAYCINDVRV